MHQTTVSRSYRDLAQQFHLQPRSQPRQACRWGTSTSLRHLRLASRAHRLEAGLLRLATDALHQSLLAGLPGLQLVPPHFHIATDWATLIAQGVIDGALVSSLCHHEPLSPARLPHWPEVQVILLGQLSLQLVCRGPSAPNGHGPWTGQLLLPAGLELNQPALVTLRAIRRRLSRAIAREAAALLELRHPLGPEPAEEGPGLAGSP